MPVPSEVYIQLSNSDRVLIVLIAASTAAALSFVSNVIHWKRNKKFEAFRSLSDELISVLDSLESHIAEYWSEDYSQEIHPRLVALETKIMSKSFAVNGLIKLMLAEKGVSKNSGFFYEHIKNVNTLYDKATGGDFEVSGRKKSKGAILSSLSTILKLKHQVYALAFIKKELFKDKYK